jgi:hypothetical protein
MILAVDITSVFKRKVYGKAGDKVKVISRNVNTMIVENEKGSRFAVLYDEITDELNPIPIMTIPSAQIPIYEKMESVPVKTSVKNKPGQQSLF